MAEQRALIRPQLLCVIFPQIILFTIFYSASKSIGFFIIIDHFRFNMEKSSSFDGWKTQGELTEMEDAAIVYKLRRSCAKIEQLRMEIDTLRRQNDMKNKLIANLQNKQRELNRSIQSLRQRIQIHGAASKNDFQKQIVARSKDQQMIFIEEQYKKLQIRYSNCEQQNIFLRSELKRRQKQINLLQQTMIIRNMQFRDLKEGAIKLEQEIVCLSKQNTTLNGYVCQLQLLASNRLQDSLKIKSQLCHYQEMLGVCSMEIRDAVGQKRQLLSHLEDINNTVDHIEQLRSVFRNKRKLCK